MYILWRAVLGATRGGLNSRARGLSSLGAYTRTVAQVLDRSFVGVGTVGSRESLTEARRRMVANNWGSLVVVDAQGRVDGIVTERDYMRNGGTLIEERKGEEGVTVGEIMSKEVVAVDASRSIGECMSVMVEHGFRHLPVTHGGEVVGVLSMRDLVREAAKDHQEHVNHLNTQISKLANIVDPEFAKKALN